MVVCCHGLGDSGLPHGRAAPDDDDRPRRLFFFWHRAQYATRANNNRESE